jgi:4'-phosphopantetheinyl transferase
MKIYICNTADVTQSELDTWFDAMGEERKNEVSRIINAKKKISKIVSDHLCRKAISESCGITDKEIVFTKNKHGKPFAENLPVFFSVSHSADMVICAVSDKEIGIDIEKIKPVNPKMSEKFATEKEIEYIRSTENGFFEIWTLKEAYFKCIGTGLGADIKNVSFEISANKIICSDNRYECLFFSAENGYICSVCREV